MDIRQPVSWQQPPQQPPQQRLQLTQSLGGVATAADAPGSGGGAGSCEGSGVGSRAPFPRFGRILGGILGIDEFR